ncbi:DUF2029 domain-containing protein [Nocardia amamiensis]|uniref:DUF2029 domain-containing protein n=1 Tax=Nocardia amamiensis TaxID=404578 RepID=A0ABS0CXL2_9NOCA|nr:glycosyltransferase 87 family protein [Nocardia amamiensis]MBF6299533.1 DUF2029 domain-containing protein [Nocardia amamiensis]
MHSSGTDERGISRRWATLALVAGGAALVVQWVLVPPWAAPQFGLLVNQGDLAIYRNGALQLLHGEPLYAAPVPPGGWFTYPPFAALCFLPMAAVSFGVAKLAWLAMSCAALWATVWRCWRMLGYRGDLHLAAVSFGLALVATVLEAVRGTLWQGQINLLLMAIIVWDLTRPRSAVLRGWSVGVATGVKLTAIVFLPYLILTRQWRAAATAASTGSATVVFTWLVAPADSRDYWGHAVRDVDRIGPVSHPGNQSLNGVLANLWAPGQAPNWVWLLCAATAAVLGYVVAARAGRAGRNLHGVTVVGLIGCVIPPLAWGHHWVWLVPLLIILLDKAIHSQRHQTAWIAATLCVGTASAMWFTSWVYAEIKHLGLTGAPSYVPAMTAAVEHMPQWVRAIVCGVPPLVYLGVVAVMLFQQSRRANTIAEQVPAHR